MDSPWIPIRLWFVPGGAGDRGGEDLLGWCKRQTLHCCGGPEAGLLGHGEQGPWHHPTVKLLFSEFHLSMAKQFSDELILYSRWHLCYWNRHPINFLNLLEWGGWNRSWRFLIIIFVPQGTAGQRDKPCHGKCGLPCDHRQGPCSFPWFLVR